MDEYRRAAGASYTPVAADEGAQLRAIVTATNAFGSASATSATIGPIVTDPPANTTAPTVSGTVQRSHALTASPGGWSGVGNSYGYQWQRSSDGVTWTNIAAATAITYTLGVAEVGLRVRVLVTATNQKGFASKASAQTQFVAPFPPANSVAPSVTGVPQRSYALSADPGVWTGAGNAITYQWQHDVGDGFEDIPGATGVTYLLSTADVGTSIRVLVTAANADATISEASDPTPPILTALPVNIAAPTISGAVVRGSTLGGELGIWTGLYNVYTWQWQRSSDNGTTWASIGGATRARTRCRVADETRFVRDRHRDQPGRHRGATSPRSGR